MILYHTVAIHTVGYMKAMSSLKSKEAFRFNRIRQHLGRLCGIYYLPASLRAQGRK